MDFVPLISQHLFAMFEKTKFFALANHSTVGWDMFLQSMHSSTNHEKLSDVILSASHTVYSASFKVVFICLALLLFSGLKSVIKIKLGHHGTPSPQLKPGLMKYFHSYAVVFYLTTSLSLCIAHVNLFI